MPSKKVDLHLANSFAELNKKISNNRTTNPKLLSNSIKKIFKEAQLKENLGDEEAAYILYSRCIESVIYLKKNKHDLGLDNASVKSAIDKAEELKESLNQRYENKQNVENGDLHNRTIETNIANIEKKDSINDLFISGNKIIPSSKLEKENVSGKELPSDKSLTSTQLYNLLYEDKENVIILDVRSTRNYNKSHINHASSTSIPEDVLRRGMTTSAIEKMLSPKEKEKFNLRGQYNYVVLLDWNSTEKNIDEKSALFALRETLTKWNIGCVLKSDPLILENGYEDWHLHYPTLTTNPSVTNEEQLLNTSTATLISLDVDYPDLNEEVVNGHKTYEDLEVIDLVQKPISVNQDVDRNGQSLFPTIDRTLKPSVVVKPKSAWQSEQSVTNQRNIGENFDRLETMTDEQLHNTVKRLEKEKDFARLCQLKENEADEELRKIKQQEADEVLEKIQQLEIEKRELEDGRKLLEEENFILKQKLSQKYVDTSQSEKAIKSKLEEKKMRDSEVENLRRERKLREMREKAKLEERKQRELREKKIIEDERKKRELEEKAEEQKRLERIEREKKIKLEEKALLEEQKQTELKSKNLKFEEIESHRADDNSSSEFTLPLKEEPSSGKRGLSRSHSSPNIAQLIEGSGKLDKYRSNTPTINRQAKPANLIKPPVDRVLKPQESSVARQRNFNPVYSSQGNAQTGLRNLGNTCFMNSVIQCLANTPSLVNYLAYRGYARDIKVSGSKGEVIEELSLLMDQLRSGNCRSITPSDFKNTVSRYLKICIGNEQQDAHEFFTKLMEKLHSEINTGDSTNKAPPPETDKMPVTIGAHKFMSWYQERNKSTISDIFEGLLLSQLTCLYCRSVSNSYEVFSCLSVPIPSSSRCSLNECIRAFLKTERISGDAGWNCPTCKQKREAEKQMFIVQLPRVLVVHLKRFSYEGMWRSKLKTMVDFPLYKLDMSAYFASGCSDYNSKFSLYGVVNHFGTLEGGHYIAACKSNADKWFKYDDQEVTEISSNSVVTDAGYIMFYNLVTL